jgi:hypothetical protein
MQDVQKVPSAKADGNILSGSSGVSMVVAVVHQWW